MSDRSARSVCDAGRLSDHPPRPYVMRSSELMESKWKFVIYQLVV
jgi:hypothetical protein